MANRIEQGTARAAVDTADGVSHRKLRGTLGVWGIVFVVVVVALIARLAVDVLG